MLLSPDPSFTLDRSVGLGDTPGYGDLDDFSFEWFQEEDPPSESQSVRNNTIDYSNVATASSAPSSGLSVTSFGELKRFQRKKVPQYLDPVSTTAALAMESTPSHTAKRLSGPLVSIHESSPTPPQVRGKLRKYASLDFDLDMIVPFNQGGSDSDSDSPTLEKTPTVVRTAPLAHLPRWSPLRNFKFPRSTPASSHAASPNDNFLSLNDTPVSAPKKLVKKARTPVIPVVPPAQQQHEYPDLPSGVQQIGNGIGYTFSRSPSQPVGPSERPSTTDSAYTATLRRSSSMLPANSRYGNLTVLPRLLRNKKRGNDSSQEKTSLAKPLDDADDLELSMRETYGSSWDLHSTGAAVRSATGLGFGLTPKPPSASLFGSTASLVTPLKPAISGSVYPKTSTPAGVYRDGARGEPLFPGSTLRLVTPTTTQHNSLRLL